MPKACHLLVLFGSTGDLTRRKLIPALYHLHRRGDLSGIHVLCVARRSYTKKQFIDSLKLDEFIADHDARVMSELIERLHYHEIDFDKPDHEALNSRIHELEKQIGCDRQRNFYLALPPNLFERVIDILDVAKMVTPSSRIALEKPFGSDLESARALQSLLLSVFKESQIYRIDHYLGKELVQNILTFRFSNAIFEQIWNHRFVDHVQVTVAESVGVEGRGGYYDKSGAIRDMVQNHLLQILLLAAMDAPDEMTSQSIHDKKVAVLKGLKPLRAEDIVIGQYAAGKVGGKSVKGYLQESGVATDSSTETYAALKVRIDTPRWKGIPFYLRTGKRLDGRYAEMNVVLKDVSCRLFSEGGVCLPRPNTITIRIQPHQSIMVGFNSKRIGAKFSLDTVEMEYCHECDHGHETPEAYEVLLRNLITGDQTMFTRWDSVEESWRYIDAIRAKMSKVPMQTYPAGSKGPKAADVLIGERLREWIPYNEHHH